MKEYEKIEVKSTDELVSGCLQSPDDVEATYRKKKNVKSRVQVVNVTETVSAFIAFVKKIWHKWIRYRVFYFYFARLA